jgi:hypothetical protein
MCIFLGLESLEENRTILVKANDFLEKGTLTSLTLRPQFLELIRLHFVLQVFLVESLELQRSARVTNCL